MKKIVLIFSLLSFLSSCGETVEEIEIKQEKVEKEVEETSNNLFESLEDDLKEAEE